MGILAKLDEERRAFKIGSVPPRDPVLAEIWGLGNITSSGVRVTSATAFANDVVYACVKVLSEGVAQVPLALFRKTDERSRERAVDHPLWRVLHDTPNLWQTSAEFREMMQGHILLRGNAYAFMVKGGGFVEQLLPLHPDRVRPFWVNERLGVRAYKFTPIDGKEVVLLDDEVFHVAGQTSNGLMGLNPIEAQRETIGTALAAQNYISRFYANNATPGGVLKHPGHFKDKETRQAFREKWHEQQTGASRHMTAVLEDGLDFQQISLKLKDAQFIEGQKLSVSQIARIFRCPPHMIGDLEKATFSNITQQSLEFVMYSLAPWFTKWEQAIFRDLLLTELDKEQLFAKFIVEGLLRGDIQTRFAAYKIAIETGFFTRNEVRELEDRNPLEGLDEPLTPLNMQQGEDGEGEPDKDDDEDDSESGQQRQVLNIVDAAIERVIRKERRGLSQIANTTGQFAKDVIDNSIQQFYSRHAVLVAEVLSMTSEQANRYTQEMANYVCDAWLEDGWDAFEEVATEMLTKEVRYYGT